MANKFVVVYGSGDGGAIAVKANQIVDIREDTENDGYVWLVRHAASPLHVEGTVENMINLIESCTK
jgi:hypothetical protein